MRTLISFDRFLPFPSKLHTAEPLFKFHTNLTPNLFREDFKTNTNPYGRVFLTMTVQPNTPMPAYGYLELGPYPGYRPYQSKSRFVHVLGFRYRKYNAFDPQQHAVSYYSVINDVVNETPIFEMQISGANKLIFKSVNYTAEITNPIVFYGYIEIVREWNGVAGINGTGGKISIYIDGVLVHVIPNVTMPGPKSDGEDMLVYLGVKKDTSFNRNVSLAICDIYSSWINTNPNDTETRQLGPIGVYTAALSTVVSNYYSKKQQNNYKLKWNSYTNQRAYLFDENNDHLELNYNFLYKVINDPIGPVKALQFYYNIKNDSDKKLYLEQILDDETVAGPVEIPKGELNHSMQKSFIQLHDSQIDQSNSNYSSRIFLGD